MTQHCTLIFPCHFTENAQSGRTQQRSLSEITDATPLGNEFTLVQHIVALFLHTHVHVCTAFICTAILLSSRFGYWQARQNNFSSSVCSCIHCLHCIVGGRYALSGPPP